MNQKAMGLMFAVVFFQAAAGLAQFNRARMDESHKTTKCGVIWGQKGDFNKAILAFNEALQQNPGYAKAYNNRGIAWYGKGCNHNALEDFSKAIEIEPDYADAFHNRGRVEYCMGDLQAAIEDFDRALLINPHFAEAYYEKGIVYEKLGKMDEALDCFKKALRLNPQNQKIYFKIVAIKNGKDLASLKLMDTLISKRALHKKSYYEKYTIWGNSQYTTSPALCDLPDVAGFKCSE